jgi:hypothetical protein
MAVVVFPTPPFWFATAMTRPNLIQPVEIMENLPDKATLGNEKGI